MYGTYWHLWVAIHFLLQLIPVHVSRQQILVLGSYEVFLVESQALREQATVAVTLLEIKLGDSIQFRPWVRPRSSQFLTTVYLTGVCGGGALNFFLNTLYGLSWLSF